MASFQPSSLLIFGATGNIGRYITNSIVNAQPPFQRVAIFTSEDTVTRKADYIKELESKGVVVIKGDVKNEDNVKSAYEGVDTVISAVGRNVLETQIDLIRIAEESSSVKWFFPSEYGTDIEYGPRSASEKPHQLKLKVRRYVKDHVSRLKYTYVVTGPYLDMFLSLSPQAVKAGGFDIPGKKAVLINRGDDPIGFTTMPDVGKAVVSALHHPETSFNKALKVQSFVVTSNEILTELEKQTGGDKWERVYYTLQEMKEAETAAWNEGSHNAVIYTLRRIWIEGGTLYEKTDNDSIELKTSDLETLEGSIHRLLTVGW